MRKKGERDQKERKKGVSYIGMYCRTWSSSSWECRMFLVCGVTVAVAEEGSLLLLWVVVLEGVPELVPLPIPLPVL